MKLSLPIRALTARKGYPGELNVTVTYRLEADKFILQYEAHTDQDTILNFTNHSYFNLSGRPCGIGEHWLQTAGGLLCLCR